MGIDLKDHKSQLAIAAAGTGLLAAGILYKRSLRNRKPRTGPLTPDTLPKGAYDAIIVGAGALSHAL